jgi:hypothetical protein
VFMSDDDGNGNVPASRVDIVFDNSSDVQMDTRF